MPIAKLGDFGTSKRLDPTAVTGSVVGSLRHMAPEIIKQLGHGQKADIWSLGGLVVEAFGERPWPNCKNGVSQF